MRKIIEKYVDLSNLYLNELPGFLSDVEIKRKTVKNNYENDFCSFNCSNNNLTSLVNAPKYVHGDFDCSNNFLTSLVGAPEIIYGDFDCTKNPITSLDGLPKRLIDGRLRIDGELEEMFSDHYVRSRCWMSKYIIWT